MAYDFNSALASVKANGIPKSSNSGAAAVAQSLGYQASLRAKAPTTPKITPQQQTNVGPTSKWARLAQVGVGKVNLFNAYQAAVEHKPANVNANNSILKPAAKAATSFGKSVVNPAVGLAKDTNKELVQPAKQLGSQIIHQPAKLASEVIHGNTEVRTQGKVYQQNIQSGKISKIVAATLGKSVSDANVDRVKEVNGLVAKGASDKQLQQYLVAKNKDDTTTANRILGEVVGTGSLFAGGGEAKGLVMGGKAAADTAKASLAKKAAGLIKDTSGVAKASAAGNAGNTLQKNPNATSKQLVTSGAEGYGAGLALGAGSKLLGKVVSLTGKALGRGDAKLGQQVAKQAVEEPKVTKIPVKDASAQKLLGPGNVKAQQTGDKGFTIASKPADTQLSKRYDEINSTLLKVAQGKASLAPDEARALAKERANISGAIREGKSYTSSTDPVVTKLVKTPASAAEVNPRAGEVSTTAPISRPKTESTAQPKEMLPDTNKKGTGLGKTVINKAATKINSKGLLNPEQDLLRNGHTDAAQAVRELASNQNVAEEKGNQVLKNMPKQQGYNENYGEFVKPVESGKVTDEAHKDFVSTYQDLGKRGVKAGSLDAAQGETYAPRNYKFNDMKNSGSVGGLRKSGDFSKGRVQGDVQPGQFGESNDKYATYAESKAAVEAAGGHAPDATTAEIHAHNVTQREKAIANAEGLNKLEQTHMGDGKSALVTYNPAKGLGKEHAGYNTSLLPGRAVHPDLVRAVKSLVVDDSNPLAGIAKYSSVAKRLITANGVVHDLNYARSSLGAQGLGRTAKALASKPTQFSATQDETKLEAIKHGAVFSNGGKQNIYDEAIEGKNAIGKQVNGVLGKARGAMDERVFGIGDHLGLSAYQHVRDGLISKGIPETEARQVAADAANHVMFTERASQSSQEMRSFGKVALFAKNFFQSTLQRATVASGITKNSALSTAAQRSAQKQAAVSLARSFTYLFAAAQAINYHATGHSTFSNKDSKISPVFYVDRSTGKSYHLSNWYGQVGELLHLTNPNAITNKLSPGIQEVSRILSNKNQLAFSNSTNVRNTSASGIRQWGEVLGNALENLATPAGIDSSQINKVVGSARQPGQVTAAQLLGFGASSTDQNKLEKDVATLSGSNVAGGAAPSPKLQKQEATARHDLSVGKTNSPAVQQVKSQMNSTQFKTFMKTGADNTTQRQFDKLHTDQKIQIINKYPASQLKEISGSSLAKTLVGSDAKSSWKALNQKGYSNEQIVQALQKVGYGKSQLDTLQAAVKQQAAAGRRAAGRPAKFVNPGT